MTTVARPVFVVANWKMHTTPSEAADLAVTIAAATSDDAVGRVICPPFVALAAVAAAVAGTGVEVGAQNVHDRPFGAHTGEISAPMLRGLASWCIVGHSERRRDQAETDDVIGRKLERCLESGLRPILCVGERLAEREAGLAEVTVRGQLKGASSALTGQGELGQAGLVVAYEPVWAIGTGRTARGVDAAAMAEVIRETLDALAWPDAAAIPVLYGGSVTSSTMTEFMAEPSIDGALVGGASLKVDEMAGIVARAALTARARGAQDPVG